MTKEAIVLAFKLILNRMMIINCDAEWHATGVGDSLP